jgi:hypothetical protein
MEDLIKLDNSIYKKDVAELTNNELSINLDGFDKLIKKLQELQSKVKAEALQRLLEDQSIKGWQVVKSKTRKAKDVKELFAFLNEHNVSKEDFLNACSVSLPKLEDAYIKGQIEAFNGDSVYIDGETANSKKPTKKQLKEGFRAITEPYLEETKEDVSVRRI